jgi:2,3-dihydroxy-2,3-dihydrophenylpropionate dehydrogenase
LFNVNVLGYLLGAKACAQALIASEGSMIFTLSNAAWYPGGGGRSTPPANMPPPG